MTVEGQNKPKQKSRLKITNAQNDARYVAAGRMLAIKRSPDADKELKTMNKKKNGAPFQYPDSLIRTLATVKHFTRLSFRRLEGLVAAYIGYKNTPSYAQIQKRVSRISVCISDNIITAGKKGDVLNLSIDGTGFSPNTRSEYIRYKHKIQHGFIRVVIVVDTDTREIMAVSVTEETIGEAPQFKDLISAAIYSSDTAVKTSSKSIRSPRHVESGLDLDATNDHTPSRGGQQVIIRADGGFDSREIFQYCVDSGIKPIIRIRHNATTRSRGRGRARGNAALEQLGGHIIRSDEFAQLTKEQREYNRKEWKKVVKYGIRWLVEIVISSLKRLFGDAVYSKKWNNIIHEIRLKVDDYNTMLRIQREAIGTRNHT